MKRLSKEQLYILLILVLFFLTAPISNAINGNGSRLDIANWGTSPVTPLPGKLENGQIWVDKSVKYLGEGEFEVTLSALGQKFKRDDSTPTDFVDVVLVLDISGSMDELGSRPEKFVSMKEAAMNAVDIILGDDYGGGASNRVAIVKYGEMADLASGFINNGYINRIRLKEAISELVADGGTNIQNGFLHASNLIANRVDKTNKPVIVLLSDGEPTYYHRDYSSQTLSNRKGDGTAENTGANHVLFTISQAVKAKEVEPDLRIYSIGFGMDSLSETNQLYAKATLMPTEENTRAYRKGFIWGIPFDHKYWEEGSTLVSEDGAEDIFWAFAKVAHDTIGKNPLSYTTNDEEGKKYHKNVLIRDLIGEGFLISEWPLEMPEGESIQIKDGELVWTIDGDLFRTLEFDNNTLAEEDIEKIHRVKFKVKIMDSIDAGTYYTNKSSNALYSVAEDNPYYKDMEDKDIDVNLENRGWLTLAKKASPKDPKDKNGKPPKPIENIEENDDGAEVTDDPSNGNIYELEDDNVGPVVSNLPKTGDDMEIPLLGWVFMASLLGIFILLLGGGNKERTKY